MNNVKELKPAPRPREPFRPGKRMKPQRMQIHLGEQDAEVWSRVKAAAKHARLPLGEFVTQGMRYALANMEN